MREAVTKVLTAQLIYPHPHCKCCIKPVKYQEKGTLEFSIAKQGLAGSHVSIFGSSTWENMRSHAAEQQQCSARSSSSSVQYVLSVSAHINTDRQIQHDSPQ